MAGVLDSVDQRTQLVGQNRLELLLFRLQGKQVYGINVFKVREVLQCPKLTQIPQRHSVCRGIAHIRGGTLSIFDLSQATGGPPLENIENCFVIIAEYNNNVQGFLVSAVERIVNLNWENIHPPPKGAGRDNYLTAVTQVEDRIVEIIDVEKILFEVAPQSKTLDTATADQITDVKPDVTVRVLIADDSSVARKQLAQFIEGLGLEVVQMSDGREAYEHLLSLANDGIDVAKHYLMLISDIEMPEMDGYTLTSTIRARAELQKMHITLHTSLSGVFNQAMVDKVGADAFLAKFNPEVMAAHVRDRIQAIIDDSE